MIPTETNVACEPTPRPTPWRPLLALVVGVVLLNVAWHATHAAPVVTGHRTLVEAVDQLAAFQADPWQHLDAMLTQEVLDHVFSLYNLSAALPVAVLGRTQTAVLLVSTLYLVLLMLSVYGIVRRLRPGPGALAGAVATLFPAAMIWSRVFSPSIALMAVSAAGVYLLVRSNWMSRPVPALLFGVLAALSFRLGETVGEGVQIQLVFASVGIYTFVAALIRPVSGRWRVLLIAAGIVAVFAAALNRPFLSRVFSYTQQEGVALADSRYVTGNVLEHPQAWLAYVSLVWHEHLGPVLCVAVLAALGVALWRPTKAEGVAIAFFVLPLFAASVVSKKAYNYVFAMLPGAAVLIGLAVGRLKSTRAAYGLTAALLAVVTVSAVWPAFSTEPHFSPPSFDGSSWHNRFLQFPAAHVNPSRNGPFFPGEIARGIEALAADGHDVNLLLLGETHVHASVLSFRFLTRLANLNRGFAVIDPLDELSRFCLERAEHTPTPDPCPEPNVIVIFPTNGEMERFRLFSGDPPAWQRYLRMKRGCVDPASPRTQAMVAATEKWTACLAALPWDSYRVRRFPAYPDAPQLRPGVLLDRPDLGVDVKLPPLPEPPAPGPMPPQ